MSTDHTNEPPTTHGSWFVDKSRYICPLDGTPLSHAGNAWHCTHDSKQRGEHETVLAYDTEDERMVRYKGSAIVPVEKA
jgi:hypothetical protein